MPSMIIESPDNVVASCGHTDWTATKTGANKALEQKNFALKKNQNSSDWTDYNRKLRLNH